MSGVAEKVHFNVNLKTIEEGGKWIAVTLETGIITAGGTEDEALAKAERWNIFWVGEQKTNGFHQLKAALDARNIPFHLESARVPAEVADATAVRNISMAALIASSGQSVRLAA